MGAAGVGVVEDGDVAFAEGEGFHDGLDGVGHGAEVNGHVVAHGDDALMAVEEGAGVVAALLDVGRDGGAAEGGAHLFGDGVDGALEDGEFDGTNGGGTYGGLVHACTSITRFRKASTRRTSPGGRMVAELYSEMMAGPAKVSPAWRWSRS